MLNGATSTDLTTNLPSNHPNAGPLLARAHHRSCAREGIIGDYDAFVVDWVADDLVSHVFPRNDLGSRVIVCGLNMLGPRGTKVPSVATFGSAGAAIKFGRM